MTVVIVKDGRLEMPQEMLDAAGISDGQEVQIEVQGPGALRVTTTSEADLFPPLGPGEMTPQERQRRLRAMRAAHPRLFSRASDEERRRTPAVTDEERERVARSLSGGKSLVEYILEERREGY